MSTSAPPRPSERHANTPWRTTPAQDVITVLAGLWLIAGLFLDGYAHQHLVTGGETFATPWHLVFYTGFAANTAWIVRLLATRPGALRDSIPVGYGAAVMGLPLFAAGGLGDLVWHTAFGVEVGIDALLSPTHLVLMAALLAIVTAPYRAARAWDHPSTARTVPLIALGIGTALVAFFANFIWGLGDGGFRTAYDPATGAGEATVIAGVASTLVTTAILVGAALLVVRLGRPGFGVFTVMLGSVSVLVHVAFEEEAIGVAAALVGGIVLDVMVAARGTRSFERTAAIATAAMWAAFYGLAAVTDRVAWPPEIWTGAIVLSTLAAFGLAHLGDRAQPEPKPASQSPSRAGG